MSIKHRQFIQVIVDWDEEQSTWVARVPSLGDLSAAGGTRDDALNKAYVATLNYISAREQATASAAIAVAAAVVNPAS